MQHHLKRWAGGGVAAVRSVELAQRLQFEDRCGQIQGHVSFINRGESHAIFESAQPDNGVFGHHCAHCRCTGDLECVFRGVQFGVTALACLSSWPITLASIAGLRL